MTGSTTRHHAGASAPRAYDARLERTAARLARRHRERPRGSEQPAPVNVLADLRAEVERRLRERYGRRRWLNRSRGVVLGLMLGYAICLERGRRR